MKKRNIPYGYKYENGCIVINTSEAQVLKRIFQSYLEGQSMLTISIHLNAAQVEYMPGLISWNKARIMRIIADERYVGKNGYPSIIDITTYSKLQLIKNEKNNQKEVDRQSDIFKLAMPVLCSNCNTEMVRHHDSRFKCKVYWTCKNTKCRTIIKIEDSDLLDSVKELLNQLILQPKFIKDTKQYTYHPTLEILNLEGEINKGIDSATTDINTLIHKIKKCVSLKYKSLPSEQNTAERLQADFESTSPLVAFSIHLVNKTVAAIRLSNNKTVQLVLRNGQVVKKER
ncbi:MAG: recombinase family protein [Clostridia bacterium]|nr:recombinase family protein [Clostridia bacterium]